VSVSFVVSSPLPAPAIPGHVAIIMDGNGRWAKARNRPRTAGHLAGAKAVRRAVETACQLGVPALTLYAFSSDNWQRPATEVTALMELFRRYIALETSRLRENDIRLSIVGRRDRLSPDLRKLIAKAERTTQDGTRLHLRVAVDYSARDAILGAASRLAPGSAATREDFSRALAESMHSGEMLPDVDLLIRTGGEQRLSDFLLWECAYAELVFTPRMWPEFGAEDFEAAVAEFSRRERRFGTA
jgi:undecaprenyl diphosphate synthase